MSESVFFVSLGCPKNLVDSEIMLGDLLKNRYSVVEEAAAADVIVVNTCSFIGPATQESVDTILDMARYKDEGSCSTLVVSGCLAQRYAEELETELPEVDYFIGTGEYQRLSQILAERPIKRSFVGVPRYVHDESVARVNSTGGFTAYLKISEGCRHRCSFCIIPTLRGDLRSRTISSVVAEAQQLSDQGVVELNIVSQDTNSFGFDRVGGIGRRTELGKLLREIAKVDGIEWIRLMYMYPLGFPESLMDIIADEPKVLPYIDMPLQHISSNILRRMRRGVGGERTRRLVGKLRHRIPELTLRTTFIVGFPGETEQEFEELCDFVEELQFERMGVFKYSPEDTTAAARYKDDVPTRVKEQRQRKLMRLQKKISRARFRSMVGTHQNVLLEGVSEESDLLLQGRLESQAPGIDGHVLINAGHARSGSIVSVKITRAMDYDVIGEIVGEPWTSGYAV